MARHRMGNGDQKKPRQALNGLVVCLLWTAPATGQQTAPRAPQAPVGPVVFPASGMTTVRITDAPYLASPAGATTTQTAGPVRAGSTALPVLSCESFGAGQGVLIRNADAPGPKYLATVESCSTSVLKITPPLFAAVASGARVQHDETVAFQTALDTLSASGGRILVPRGDFRINGPLQDPAGANAILKVASLSYTSQQPVVISITGEDKPAGAGGYDRNAPTLQTDTVGGALIGGYNAASRPYPPFTNVWLNLENLQLVGYHDPDFIAVDAHAISAFQGHHLTCNTGPEPEVADPTHPASWCIKMPSLLNNYVNELDDVISVGFYNGFTLAEHTVVGAAHAVTCHNGFIFDSGSNPSAPKSYLGNSIYAAHLDTLLCHNSMVGGGTETPVFIASADLEIARDFDVYDPGNKLLGVLHYNDPYNAPLGRPQIPPRIQGAANLAMTNLRSARSQTSPPAPEVDAGRTGEEVVTSSAKALDPGIRSSIVSLGADYTFTLAPGPAGALKCLTFVQPAAGGPFVVTPPQNLLGFAVVGTRAGKRSTQCFNYSASQRAWLPTSPGVQNY